jgi:hypothetical protein
MTSAILPVYWRGGKTIVVPGTAANRGNGTAPVRWLSNQQRMPMTTREVYIAKMKAHLDELDHEMTQMGLKAKEAQAQAKETYKEQIAKLHAQQRAAMVKFDEIKASGEDSWDRMRNEMDNVRDAFVLSFREFKSHL